MASARTSPSRQKRQHFVYLFETEAGSPRYVGYGTSVGRAIDQVAGSHNAQLRAWLEEGSHRLSIAGPYRDEREGKAVEAALISALQPEYNVAPGEGPKFRPLGVPPAFADRVYDTPLTRSEIGRAAGGALIVYLSPGDFLSDGRAKYDPSDPDSETIVSNLEGVWDLRDLVDQWRRRPEASPRTLVGVHGKPKHRFVVGAMAIDTGQWGAEEFFVPIDKRPDRWCIPLKDRGELDVAGLRGRRVADAKFSNMSTHHYIWVDGRGRIRHPTP